ncbi:MAG: FmdE family protein [Methanomassiliicoccaceae archaeon]|nr:FmdE family protein [Methanomassiliicoccaceae archaeon]
MNKKIWEKCAEFHGHKCPGLAFGYRAAETAIDILGLGRSDDEEVVCISETDACSVDAIQCMLSCTAGKGNLLIKMTGKNAYSFFDRRSGKSIRILTKRFEKPAGNERNDFMEFILNAPSESLFIIGDVKHALPEKAKIYDSAVCSECGEPFRSDLATVREGCILCIDCSRS